jgi:hypothetical protein
MGKEETPVSTHEDLDHWWGNTQRPDSPEEPEHRPFTQEDKRKFLAGRHQ